MGKVHGKSHLTVKSFAQWKCVNKHKNGVKTLGFDALAAQKQARETALPCGLSVKPNGNS